MSADDQLKGLLTRWLTVQLEHSKSTPPPAEEPTELKKVEDRLLSRFNATESFLMNNLDEHAAVTGILVSVFVMMCLFLFYRLIEQSLAVQFRRLPNWSHDQWNAVLAASQYTIRAASAATVATNTTST